MGKHQINDFMDLELLRIKWNPRKYGKFLTMK